MKLPALPVGDALSTLNFEAIARALSTAPYFASGAGSTTTSTALVVGPSLVVANAGTYRVDFGGSIQLQTTNLEQGNLVVHLAGAPVGPTAFFTGQTQYDGASVASSFDVLIAAGAALDLRYSTNIGTSTSFTRLWLRATLLPS